MIPNGLKIALFVGLVAGAVTALMLADIRDDAVIEYTEYPSLIVLTDKPDYKKGESVIITVINSGNESLFFSDKSYGFKITGLSGMLISSHSSSSSVMIDEQTDIVLEPKEVYQMFWNQQNNDGDQVFDGIYKISIHGFDGNGDKIEQTKTINVIEADLTFGS